MIWSTATKSGRLRLTGIAVLAAGLVAAAVFYAFQKHQTSDNDPNVVLGRYERDMRHDIGVQQGTMGLILMEWQETFAQPGAQALMIVGVAAVFSAGFFRAAWVIDDDERERRQAERGGDP